MEDLDRLNEAIAAYSLNQHDLRIFMNGIAQWFGTHPSLALSYPPTIHSVKARLKDEQHLKDKILRKQGGPEPINGDNLFDRVTDLAGVRVMHLYQEQFAAIHKEIWAKVEAGDWYLPEPPKAYSWDPESKDFFERLGIEVQIKDSFYTSVHYLLKPKSESNLCCELQVRTLFEEIWGEVDHVLNYPTPSTNVACREQLRVLAKVVGAGSRLVDSLFRTANT